MDIEELQDRLRAKSAEDATPKLDFDAKDVADGNPNFQSNVVTLPPQEGERCIVAQDMSRQARSSGTAQLGRARRQVIVSLSDAQYGQFEQTERNNEGYDDALLSDSSVDSGRLSMSSHSEEERFDASLRWAEMEDNKDRIQRKQLKQGKKTEINITCDADIMKLMDMQPEELLSDDEGVDDRATAVSVVKDKACRKKHRQLANRKNVRDPRYRTDVFTVQQAIRESRRNMPPEDFMRVVNFIVRGLKFIKHYSEKEHITYWHVQDPAFRATMGANSKNPYTQQLLREMGFTCVNKRYWVWPQKHLYSHNEIHVWGRSVLPPQCPGTDAKRLDDLIELFQHAQRKLAGGVKKNA